MVGNPYAEARPNIVLSDADGGFVLPY